MSDERDVWLPPAHALLVAHAADNWFQVMEYEAARVADGEFTYEQAPLLSACLPPTLAERYDASFLARFARAAGELSARVQLLPTDPFPSCVVVAIAGYAEILAEDELPASAGIFDGEAYIEYTMQDDDVRLLGRDSGAELSRSTPSTTPTWISHRGSSRSGMRRIRSQPRRRRRKSRSRLSSTATRTNPKIREIALPFPLHRGEIGVLFAALDVTHQRPQGGDGCTLHAVAHALNGFEGT